MMFVLINLVKFWYVLPEVTQYSEYVLMYEQARSQDFSLGGGGGGVADLRTGTKLN